VINFKPATLYSLRNDARRREVRGRPTLQDNSHLPSYSGMRHLHSKPSICLITLLVFWFLATPALWAVDPSRSISQYGHTSWLVKDGYFSGIPRKITQTADGYIWLGTTEGLFRFDGIHFVHWSPPVGEDLPSPRVNSLLPTPDGSLWIGTATGISRWKDGHLTNISGGAGVVPSISEAHDGKIWFVLDRSSGAATPLCFVVGTGMRCYGAKDGIPADNCGAVVQDARGAFWIGCDSGLAKWNFNEHDLFKPSIDKPTDKPVIAISAVNQPPLVETEQYRPEESFQRPTAPLRVRYCEGPDVHGIVAHGAAKDQGCWSKVVRRSWPSFTTQLVFIQIPAKSSALKLVSMARFY